MFQNIIISFQ